MNQFINSSLMNGGTTVGNSVYKFIYDNCFGLILVTFGMAFSNSIVSFVNWIFTTITQYILHIHCVKHFTIYDIYYKSITRQVSQELFIKLYSFLQNNYKNKIMTISESNSHSLVYIKNQMKEYNMASAWRLFDSFKCDVVISTEKNKKIYLYNDYMDGIKCNSEERNYGSTGISNSYYIKFYNYTDKEIDKLWDAKRPIVSGVN